MQTGGKKFRGKNGREFFLTCTIVANSQFRGVQKTHRPAKPDLTRPLELGRFLRLGGLGWVTKFFLWRVGLGLGHKITNLPNPI